MNSIYGDILSLHAVHFSSYDVNKFVQHKTAMAFHKKGYVCAVCHSLFTPLLIIRSGYNIKLIVLLE